ncbi:MAG: PP2C family protein-serine/threonine phosphatase [Candidatus Binatia bacterium]
MPEIDFFQLTDVGCVRTGNEDAVGYWPHEDGIVFAVADGLGGHNAGEVASSLALEALAHEIERAPGNWSMTKRLRRAIQEANLAIYNKGVTVPELHRMGTTLTVAALVAGNLTAAHVGDCRLYLWRNGTLAQLTKDHTWVWEQVQYGLLSPEEARTHPRRHILSRCLGHNLIVSIDTLTLDIQPGDVLVQCSDGIHALLPESEIVAALQGSAPEAACQALIERGRAAGGDDNLSIQIAAVLNCPPSNARRWWQFGR